MHTKAIGLPASQLLGGERSGEGAFGVRRGSAGSAQVEQEESSMQKKGAYVAVMGSGADPRSGPALVLAGGPSRRPPTPPPFMCETAHADA